MTAAETIKSGLSMWDVAERYGYVPNQSGKIHCPFHEDKTASLKIYKEPRRGFYCYGCSSGGSVIDFTMRLFDIDFMAACVRLNHDFNLGISSDKPDPHEMAEFARKRRERRLMQEQLNRKINELCEEHRRLWQAYLKQPPKPGEAPSPAWLEAVHRREYIEYQIEELQEQERQNQ